MKIKTVCVSIAVATSMATSTIFVPQDYALAQNSQTQNKQANSRASKSLEIQWLLGFIPWPQWNNSSSQNSGNGTIYANNPNNPTSTKIGKPNGPKAIGKTKQGYNHKEAPVPVLIPGLVALGAGLVRKHRQEQKQMEMK